MTIDPQTPTPAAQVPASRRAIARDAMREEVRWAAIALFAKDGFDETTAEAIGEASGVSVRTFFRYFPHKEDVLTSLFTPLGIEVRDAFVEQPAEAGVWSALRAAFDPVVRVFVDDPRRKLGLIKVLTSTPSLRSHHHEKHLMWAGFLLPAVEARLDGSPHQRALRAQTLTHNALACLDVASVVWADAEGEADLVAIMDEVFIYAADLGSAGPRHR